MRAYVRRKQYEAQLIAVEVGKVVAHLFGGKPASEPAARPAPQWAEMGIAPPPDNAQTMTAAHFRATMGAARTRFKQGLADG